MSHRSFGPLLLLGAALCVAFAVLGAPAFAAPLPAQGGAYAELDSPDADVRAAAVQAIHAARDAAAVSALVAHIADGDQRVGLYIAQALVDLATPNAIVRLRAILWNGETDARWRAAYVLGARADVRSIPALARALRDEEVLVSRYAAEALGKIDGVAGIRALVGSLASERQSEVYAARAGLLALGDKAVPQLARALESADPNVEKNASIVLQAIGTPRALDALR